MRVASTGWAVVYYVSTMASLGTLVAIPTGIFANNLDGVDPDLRDAIAWLGAAAGALLGLWLARSKRSSPTAHRVLRIVGSGIVLLGLAGGIVAYVQLQQPRDNSGNMMAGLGEVIMALFALAVAGVGAVLWLAGFSGRRMAQPCAATDGPPPQ